MSKEDIVKATVMSELHAGRTAKELAEHIF